MFVFFNKILSSICDFGSLILFCVFFMSVKEMKKCIVNNFCVGKLYGGKRKF